MRLDELVGENFFSGQQFEPPGAVPFGAGFHAVNEVAFADDTDQGLLIVDHRHGANAVGEQYLRDLRHGRIRVHRDNGGHHDIGGFHFAHSFENRRHFLPKK